MPLVGYLFVSGDGPGAQGKGHRRDRHGRGGALLRLRGDRLLRIASPLGPRDDDPSLQLDQRGFAARSRGPVGRPVVDHDVPVRNRHLGAHSPLFDRLHARRKGLPQVLLVPEPLRVLHADVGPRQQSAAHLRGLGRRGGLLVLAGELLLHQGQRRLGRQEGLPLQPGRRLRTAGRDVPALPLHPHTHLRRHLSRRRHALTHGGDADSARSAARGHRQERPDSALQLVARRHGRPDPGLGPHPRRDHGDRGGVPARAHVAGARDVAPTRAA